MWFDHLRVITENWRRGAAKAAETRKKKRALQQAGQAKPLQAQAGPKQARHFFL